MQTFCDKILHAGILITQNDNRDILKNVSLCISGDKIIASGDTDQISQNWTAPVILDHRAHLVMPGLINAHSHAAMTFLRGLAEDRPLLSWLKETVFPLEAKLTKEIVRLGSLLGHAEMLAGGITACIDMYLFEAAVFEAAIASGIRCLGGEAIFEFPSAASDNWREALEHTCALADAYRNNERIKVAINPHSVYTTTPEILKACLAAAQERHLPIHIHLAENRQESRLCLDRYNTRPVSWLIENGIFTTPVIAAHMVDLTEDEIRSLRKFPLVVAHNPTSNLKLASGLAPVTELLDQFIPVALGTDGAASNNTLNIFSEMKLATILQKNRKQEPASINAQTALDMATIAGAKAFGDSTLGVLAPGYKADIVALDLNLPHMKPLHDPVAQIVYAANGSECVMTMTGGEILYENGRFTRFDINDLYAELEAIYKFVSNKSQGSHL